MKFLTHPLFWSLCRWSKLILQAFCCGCEFSTECVRYVNRVLEGRCILKVPAGKVQYLLDPTALHRRPLSTSLPFSTGNTHLLLLFLLQKQPRLSNRALVWQYTQGAMWHSVLTICEYESLCAYTFHSLAITELYLWRSWCSAVIACVFDCSSVPKPCEMPTKGSILSHHELRFHPN